MAPPLPTSTEPVGPSADNGSYQEAVTTTNAMETVVRAPRLPPEDHFWDFAEIDGARWNQLWPYRLSIYKWEDGAWVPAPEYDEFTLPMPPESLSISMAPAISTTVTLGGILEEHNGAPLRQIQLSGTTGVFPLRGSTAGHSVGSRNSLQSVFAGTIQSAQGIGNALGRNQGKAHIAEPDADALKKTGYYQFKLLERFLETYLALKKSKKGAPYALAFEAHKDNATYLVTPTGFSCTRSAASPLEYQYSLMMMAWRRVVPTTKADAIHQHQPFTRDNDNFRRVINAMRVGSDLLERSRKVLESVRGDVVGAMGILRELSLMQRAMAGAVIRAADLPADIIRDMGGALLESWNDIQDVGANLEYKLGVGLVNNYKDAVTSLTVATAATGLTPSGAGVVESPNPTDKVLKNPGRHYEFLATLDIGQMKLPHNLRARIADEKRRVQSFSRADIDVRRQKLQQFRNDYERSVGLHHATVDAIYGLTPFAPIRTATDEDYRALEGLNQVLMGLDAMAATTTVEPIQMTAMEYVAGAATRAGIAFRVPTSKFLVPMPYGYTLEQLAAQYLGDPDRWMEIATLNGLQSPYIDEVGFQIPLIANGAGRTVTVADASKLYVNQTVWVSSIVTLRTKRRIAAIQTLSDTIHVITLTGDEDLDTYWVANGAKLQAFLPNTINSMQSLYIPSDETSDLEYGTKAIPGVDMLDPMVRVGGVDLLLSTTGDLVITPEGDARLAVGLTNVIQKVRLAVATQKGSLARHPEYGLPIKVGMSIADTSASEILKAAKGLFKGDNTFAGVRYAAVDINGPAAALTIAVELRGVSQVIPVTVKLS